MENAQDEEYVMLSIRVVDEKDRGRFFLLCKAEKFLKNTLNMENFTKEARDLYESTLFMKNKLMDIREIKKPRKDFSKNNVDCEVEIHKICSRIFSEKEFEDISSKAA